MEEFEGIVGKSKKMQDIFKDIAIVSKSESSILIEGESGTGKELVARAIHRLSKRKDKPFVAVNCSAIPSELFENEFFGHEKGAYTGANQREIGKTELAGEGTFFEEDAMELLMDYDWPGNVRQLENVIERAVVLYQSEFIKVEHLPKRIKEHSPKTVHSLDLDSAGNLNLFEIEKNIINQTKTAQGLGISRKQLRTKMKKLWSIMRLLYTHNLGK